MFWTAFLKAKREIAGNRMRRRFLSHVFFKSRPPQKRKKQTLPDSKRRQGGSVRMWLSLSLHGTHARICRISRSAVTPRCHGFRTVRKIVGVEDQKIRRSKDQKITDQKITDQRSSAFLGHCETHSIQKIHSVPFLRDLRLSVISTSIGQARLHLPQEIHLV